MEKIKVSLTCYLFDMLIRNATLNDAEIIAENNLLLAQESENIRIKHEMVIEGVKTIITDEQKGFYLVVENRNEIIGQMMITFEWSDWRNKNIWWLQSVYVRKGWRRKGIFTQLLKTIKQRALEHNVDVLRLYVHKNNKNAKKTYQQLKMIKEPYDIYQMEL